MAAPTASDVATFLGPNITVDTAQATSVIAVVTAEANAYTRGEGFTAGVPNSDISAVILTASARLLSHPRQNQSYETFGPAIASFGASLPQWSVAEKYVLDRYRVRAL
ncbi:hypothetical protein [Mycobacterium arosiense]|uniref:Uncharacterized protein n=1 Tax=Mycobacterium arosiense ATCC BAA-1401 = DSM 45069 TaxID=1265311 RepID=A0A1W9ZKC3_MYCAI|nr:hypothetical protein [Mycobacterium arosiense]ORA17362.1 hypothetical protein BST14_08805 [Mycobacterium arosiense ATCC BAA-1401 = DSM 45069]